MEQIYSRELKIAPSLCDNSGRLSMADTFDLFMDIATEHADSIGIGANMLYERGLFWLTVKTKIHFNKRPRMSDVVIASTWPLPHKMARCERDYSITTGEQMLVFGKTEWAVLEVDSGKLHSLEDVYPKELTFERGSLFEEPFAKIGKDFSSSQELGTYTVRSVDIDLGGHMNNACYVHALLGLFSSAQLKEMRLNDLEINFLSPCFEGETLTYLGRQEGTVLEVGVFKPDGKLAMLGRLEGSGK